MIHRSSSPGHRYQTHAQRNSESKVKGRDQKEKLRQHLLDVFNLQNEKTAYRSVDRLIDFYSDKCSKLTDWLEESLPEALTIFELPEKHRKRLRTNNCIERFKGKIKRRTKVVRIFPNKASSLRIVNALCLERSEEWITGRRYFKAESLREYLSEKVKSKQKKTGDDLDLKC